MDAEIPGHTEAVQRQACAVSDTVRSVCEGMSILSVHKSAGLRKGPLELWMGRGAVLFSTTEFEEVRDMIKKYTIKENECGYLTKNGRFVKILTAGTYHFLNRSGYLVQITEMRDGVNTFGIPEEILMKDQGFASRVVKAALPDTSIALRFVNGAFKEVLTKPENLFWNVFEKNEFQLIDMTASRMEDSLPRMYMDLMPARYYKKIVVKDGERGLLYRDGRYEETLETGVYHYWNYGKEVTCKIFNMKLQQVEISGQEILTADKVGLRINMVCSYRILDPLELVQRVEGVQTLLYTCAQLAAREYVGRFKLDELLEQKEQMGQYILERMKALGKELCVEVVSAGVKDMILPGEIREIMNTVLLAEKRAQANMITRREEVASTRSLLNTARLLEENETLRRLKEMEYLEKICDKVGTITIHGGKGILEQLGELV